jgi:hypothetical protein
MEESKTKTKTKGKRCGVCKTSLAAISYTCKCEKHFCINHLPALEHACAFNYRADGLAKLNAQLDVSGLSSKIVRI